MVRMAIDVVLGEVQGAFEDGKLAVLADPFRSQLLYYLDQTKAFSDGKKRPNRSSGSILVQVNMVRMVHNLVLVEVPVC